MKVVFKDCRFSLAQHVNKYFDGKTPREVRNSNHCNEGVEGCYYFPEGGFFVNREHCMEAFYHSFEDIERLFEL